MKRIAGIAAVISAAALLSGCGHVGSQWKPGRPVDSSPSAGPGITVGTPPPGFGAKAWSADLRWTEGGVPGVPTYPPAPATFWEIGVAQLRYGAVATIGDVVVVPFLPPGGGSSTLLSLRFLNGRTGAVIADRPLHSGRFEGIRARTVGGKPLVEVRYAAPQPVNEVNALFDGTGQQVWTSEGKSLGSPLAAPVGDMTHGGLFAGGYRLRYTTDAYDVVDVAERTVLTIPVNANSAAGIRNQVSLAGGYAVVSTADQASDNAPVTTHIAVYDLAANGKKIATLSETTVSSRTSVAAAAAIGGKLLLTWMGPTQPPAQREYHQGPYQDFFLTVLDTATGRSTTPVDSGAAPTGMLAPPGAFVDPATSTVIEYDIRPNAAGVGLPSVVMFAVDLAHGTVKWKRQNADTLEPLSAHGGVIYGLQPASGKPHLIAVGEADGKTTADGFTAAPLVFTAGGAPVFVEPTVAPPSPSPSRSTAPSPSRVSATAHPPIPPATNGIQVWVPAH